MKRKIKIIICASAASVLAFSVLAQDAPNPNKDRPDYAREGMSRPHQLKGAAKASDVIGMTVQNNQGEKLGKVEDIAVDVESGRIVQVMLSSGGFIGIDQTITAVPPGALHCDADHKFLTLDASREKLKGAPAFDSAKWSEEHAVRIGWPRFTPITANNRILPPTPTVMGPGRPTWKSQLI